MITIKDADGVRIGVHREVLMMRVRIGCLFGVCLVAFSVRAELRIAEICPRPEEKDPNGRESGWIELWNDSEVSVDLADYRLVRFNRGKKDKTKNRLQLQSKVLAPGERFVVWSSESYSNFLDIGGSGAVAWLKEPVGELAGEELMVFPVKINPKKYPTVRLYKGESTLLETFVVPVDLADGKSFGPGSETVCQGVVDGSTAYAYRVGAEAWQTGGVGALAVVAEEAVAPVADVLVPEVTPDREDFAFGAVTVGGVTRQAWDLTGNEAKNQGLTVPAETLAAAELGYTVACWFKVEKGSGSGDGTSKVIFDYRPKSVEDKSGVILVVTSEGQLWAQARDAKREVSQAFPVNSEVDYGDGAWHHVAMTLGRKAGDRVTLWADGERWVDTTLSFDVAARQDIPLCFGRAYDSTTWAAFDGALADIRLYPRCLADEEMAALPAEDAAVREITGELTAEGVTQEAETGHYIFSGTGTTAQEARVYSKAASSTLATAGETLDFWILPETFAVTSSNGGGVMLLDARNENASVDGYVLVARADGTLWIERRGSGSAYGTVELGVTLQTQTWVHLTMVHEAASGVCTFYVNGVKRGDFVATDEKGSAIAYTPPAGNHYFCGSRDDYWSIFQGKLAEPRLFSGALRETAVAQLHNASALSAEVGKVYDSPLVTATETVVPVAQMSVVEMKTDVTLASMGPKDTLTVSATVSGGELQVWLGDAEVELGVPVAGLSDGAYELRWRLTPAADVTVASVALSADVDYFVEALTRVIMPTPTPGAANDLTDAEPYGPNIGPAIGTTAEGTGVTAASPATPQADYPVSYEIYPLPGGNEENDIVSVALLYRADFGEVKQTMMALGADGLWSATIPAGDLPAEGHLLRYAALITDRRGNTWRSPSFKNPDDGYEWFGTLVKGAEATNATLQTFHLFADATAMANMDRQYEDILGSLPLGARVGVFDEQRNIYYDNVRIDLRGNTSANFRKKSHGLRFSKCQPLVCNNPFDNEEITVRKTSFIAEYCDPIYIRQALSFYIFRQAGNLVPFDYPVQLNLNGSFYQLAFHSNRFTDELIEDYYGFGKDDGSVGYGYKNVGPFNNANQATATEKKTPDDGNEKDLVVLEAFSNSLPTNIVSTEANHAKYTQCVVEKFNLPAWLNYLATARVTHEADDVWANISAYYDNLYTDTWMPLAYDLNLSFGQWYYNDDTNTGRIGLRATDDTFKSHPFYGGFQVRAHRKDGSLVGAANRAVEALWQNEKFRRLYLRRLRTLMDAYLLAPGTAKEKTPIWQQAEVFRAAIESIVDTDRIKWNYETSAKNTAIWVWDSSLTLQEGFDDLWTNYIELRRTHLYVTHSVDNTEKGVGYDSTLSAGIPAAQSAWTTLAPGFSFENDFATDDSLQDFAAGKGVLVIRNDNDETVDMSGWQLSGAVVWTLPSGTVIDAKDVLYVVADRKAYVAGLSADAKAAAPIVVGNAAFDAAAVGVALTAADGTSICSVEWEAPSNEKNYLRVIEAYACTADNEGDGAEYVVLKNISADQELDLSGVRLTSQKRDSTPKVDITLASGTLAPGATYRLNRADFTDKGWDKITNGAVDMYLYDAKQALIQSIGFTSSGAADGLGASMVTESTRATLVDSDWHPSFDLPDETTGGTPSAVTQAIVDTPEICAWLSGLGDAGRVAIADFSGTAVDLEICYLVNIMPQAEPQVKLTITNIERDTNGNLVLAGTLAIAGEECSLTVNGKIVLESFSELTGTPTELPLDERTFPLNLSNVTSGGAHFFRLRIK